MKTPIVLAAILALPVVLQGCEPKAQAPGSAAAGDDKQAMSQTLPDRTIERAPPAAGIPSGVAAPQAEPTAPPSASPPAADYPSSPPAEPKTGN